MIPPSVTPGRFSFSSPRRGVLGVAFLRIVSAAVSGQGADAVTLASFRIGAHPLAAEAAREAGADRVARDPLALLEDWNQHDLQRPEAAVLDAMTGRHVSIRDSKALERLLRDRVWIEKRKRKADMARYRELVEKDEFLRTVLGAGGN